MSVLLSKRTVLAVAVLLGALEYAGNAFTLGLTLVLIQAAVICVAAIKYRRPTRIKTVFVFCILGEATLLTVPYQLMSNNSYDVGVLGIVGLGVSQVCFGIAAVALLRARMASLGREGLLDGAAALVGVTAIQWQISIGADQVSLIRNLEKLAPLVVGVLMVGVFVMLGRLFFTTDASKTPVLAVLLASSLMAVSVILTRSYTDPTPVFMSFSALLVAGYLLGCAISDDRLLIYATPPTGAGEAKSGVAGWLGPASALVVTPAIFTVLLVRREAPSAVLACVAALLTVVVLWRIFRLLRERETSRQALIDSESRFRQLVQHSADVIAVVDQQGLTTYLTGGARQLFGTAQEELIGRDILTTFDVDDARQISKVMDESTSGASISVGRDIRLVRPNGTSCWVSIFVSNHLDDPGISGYVINLHDVTERKEAEEALAHLALSDSLTGLPNRTQMLATLQCALDEKPGRTALLFCDLDGFKAVNDFLGHEAGDEVLQGVVDVWAPHLGGHDAIGRWGGDEFLVVCQDVGSGDSPGELAQHLLDALKAPLSTSGGEARLGVSIGLAVHAAGEDLDLFIGRADAAMYEAKRAHSGLQVC